MEPKKIEFRTHDDKAYFLRGCLAELEAHGWDPKLIYGTHLALDEALVNALRHGNNENCDKLVIVVYLITAEACSFEITDEGEGFNPNNLPDPLDPENLERPAGRGVFLMRHYMNEVIFNNKGNSVRMKKINPLYTAPATT